MSSARALSQTMPSFEYPTGSTWIISYASGGYEGRSNLTDRAFPLFGAFSLVEDFFTAGCFSLERDFFGDFLLYWQFVHALLFFLSLYIWFAPSKYSACAFVLLQTLSSTLLCFYLWILLCMEGRTCNKSSQESSSPNLDSLCKLCV